MLAKVQYNNSLPASYKFFDLYKKFKLMYAYTTVKCIVNKEKVVLASIISTQLDG